MNITGMGDAASASGAGRDMREPKAAMVEQPGEVKPGHFAEPVEIPLDPAEAPPAKLDLTKPEAAIVAGLEVAGPEVSAAVAVPMDSPGPDYGLRPDGTPKGEGYFGPLRNMRGETMTEYSVGVQIDGKEMDIPTIVPTLTSAEVRTILSLPKGALPPEEIVAKAAEHAKKRLQKGLPVFAQPGEKTTPRVVGPRFDPREWVSVPGYWPMEQARPRLPERVRAPEVNVEGKQQPAMPARPATIGGILRDGFGRKVRSASGGFVKTRF